MPSGGVRSAVVVVKCEQDIGRDGPTPQELLNIVSLERFIIAVIIIFGPFRMAQTGCVAIQCEAQAVDDRGFSGPCLTRDEEQVFAL